MKWEENADKLMDYVISAIETSKDFAIEQAPLIVQEFYMWYTAVHIFWVVFGLVFIYLAWYLHTISLNPKGHDTGFTHKRGRGIYYYENEYTGENNGLFMLFPIIISFLIGILTFLVHLYNLIFILVAPRIYLLDKIAGWF